MTYEYYAALPDTEKEIVMWLKGTLVAERMERARRYRLFQIDGFYVELICDLHNPSPTTIDAFNSTDRLDPYLPLIKIIW